MDAYAIELSHKAAKQFAGLAHDVQRRLATRIEALGIDPRPPGVEKLAGVKNAWRVRVGDYRIVFTIDDADAIILVTRVAHRSDVYRGL